MWSWQEMDCPRLLHEVRSLWCYVGAGHKRMNLKFRRNEREAPYSLKVGAVHSAKRQFVYNVTGWLTLLIWGAQWPRAPLWLLGVCSGWKAALLLHVRWHDKGQSQFSPRFHEPHFVQKDPVSPVLHNQLSFLSAWLARWKGPAYTLPPLQVKSNSRGKFLIAKQPNQYSPLSPAW